MKSGHYSVHPRFTCGSGAMVDEATALRVAAQEKESYEHCLSGVYGLELKTKAENQGLVGIAEHLTETRKGWQVHDLITNETYLRPFTNVRRSRTGRTMP